MFTTRKCDNVGELNPQQLILISLEDEEIEVGDLVFNPIANSVDIIQYVSKKDYNFGAKKVIATQSQISSEYITRFVDQYNNGKVEDLEIKITNEPQSHKDIDKLVEGTIYLNQPKLTNGFVTIVEKQPILYTEEEAKELIWKVFRDIDNSEHFESHAIDWFELNKKK